MTKRFQAPAYGCILTMTALLGAFGPIPASAQVRPAAVKNVDEPGRVPYQTYLSGAKGGTNCGANFCNFSLPAVPTGKRLVITNFAGNIALAGTATVGRLTMTIDSAHGPIFELPNNPLAYNVDPISVGSPNRYAFNEKVLLFAEAGQTPAISFYTSGSLADLWPQGLIVTGYLVDITI